MGHQTTEQGVRPFVWVTAVAVIGLTLVIGLTAKLTSDSPSPAGEYTAREVVDGSPNLPEPAELSRPLSIPTSRAERERSRGKSFSGDTASLSVEPAIEPDYSQQSRSSEGESIGKVTPWPSSKPSAASGTTESLAAITADLRSFARITSANPADRRAESTLRPSTTPKSYWVSLEDYNALTREELRIDTLNFRLEQDYSALEEDEQRLFVELESARQRAKAEGAALSIKLNEVERNQDELLAAIDELNARMDMERARVRENDPASVNRYNQLVDEHNAALTQLKILNHELKRTMELEVQAAEYAVNGIERDFMTKAGPFNIRVDEHSARVQDLRAMVEAYNAKLERVGTLVR